MNFFEHQRQARKESLFLFVLFGLAVLCVVVAVNIAVFAGLEIYLSMQSDYPQYSDAEVMDLRGLVLFAVTPFTLLVIAVGSLFKTTQLRFGQGRVVAEQMGARRISADTTHLDEKRLVNVVEEMAIASGSNVPSIWVMDDEPGINAFAAGFVPSEATIVVSRGCLTELTRDELQGVVAHEFSHIFNGDMRTNLRILGLLHGILAIGLAGYAAMRVLSYSRTSRRTSSSDKRDSNAGAVLLAILIVAVLLWVVGYVGVLFGRIIKASLSRAREFLADASAVQFTRNPVGIAGALKKIHSGNGSKLSSKNAEQFSHFYFADGIGFHLPFFATHPALTQRLDRILPSWKTSLSVAKPEETNAHKPQAKRSAKTGIIDSIGTSGVAQIAYASALLESIPDTVHKLCAVPEGAELILMALIHAEHPALPPGIEAVMAPTANSPSLEILRDAHQRIRDLGYSSWLGIAELCMPTLQQRSAGEREQLLRKVSQVVMADGRTTAFEASILSLLERSLAPSSEKRTVKHHRQHQIRAPLISVAAYLASEGAQDPADQYTAFRRGLEHASIEGYTPEHVPLVSADALPRLLKEIAQASAELKQTVMQVLIEVSLADGKRTPRETEILRTVAAALECPIPPAV
jgi:Zn-dependent protease with chaperone function/uncharacterized tellurite resistance protein B-like protein